MIVTDNQTRGRGQRGNEWFSEAHKNLTFSIILKPIFVKPVDQFNLTMAISLALRDFLTQRVKRQVKIKWPNDILIGDKKLSGILIENSLAGDAIQYSVVGIGLNVNQDSFLIKTATSMKEIVGQEFILTEELSLLMEFLEQRYLHLRSGKINDLRNDYLNSLYGKGESRKFIDETGEWQGIIEGVNQWGKLIIYKHGLLKSFDLKEIVFID
jgi:BirA family biotin operon repressor/biotin-[acetyl-CoA-carboxylase] ligase